MARIVREFDCGVVAPDFTLAALVETIRELSAPRIAALKQGADRAAAVHNAENNRDVVLRMVDDALATAER